jgi:hypothetical protein
MTGSLHHALEETLGVSSARSTAFGRAKTRRPSSTMFAPTILELVERNPGIEAASDDLYAVLKEPAGGADRGSRMPPSPGGVHSLRRPARLRAPERTSARHGARLTLITGAQIRQARKLLGWEPSKLARRAKMHSLIIERAESVAGEPPITAYQAAFIREALLNAGVEFTNGDEPGAKLRRRGRS